MSMIYKLNFKKIINLKTKGHESLHFRPFLLCGVTDNASESTYETRAEKLARVATVI